MMKNQRWLAYVENFMYELCANFIIELKYSLKNMYI